MSRGTPLCTPASSNIIAWSAREESTSISSDLGEETGLLWEGRYWGGRLYFGVLIQKETVVQPFEMKTR